MNLLKELFKSFLFVNISLYQENFFKKYFLNEYIKRIF